MNSHILRSHLGRAGWAVRVSPIHSPVRFSLGQIRPLIDNCRGSLLLETVIAVMVFSMVGTAVMAGLNTAYTSGARVETQSEAENIARNQMESVFSQPYQAPGSTPYPTISPPAGYSIGIITADAVTPVDPDIEKVTVTVSRDGQDILVLTGIRFNN